MCEHEQVHCPRCNTGFECKVGSISLCQCTAVTLNDEERQFIRQQYEGCLCAACMKQLKQEYYNGSFHDKLNKISTLFNQG